MLFSLQLSNCPHSSNMNLGNYYIALAWKFLGVLFTFEVSLFYRVNWMCFSCCFVCRMVAV